MEHVHEPKAVLDYASPRKWSKARLPAQSLLMIKTLPDGSAHVVETLVGKPAAVGAIAFAAFPLVLNVIMFAHEFALFVTKNSHYVLSNLIVLGMPIAATVIVMIMLVLQTWRKTILRADADFLELTFCSLLTRFRLSWKPPELSMIVVTTQMQENAPVLGELQLRPADGPLVRLLTDHRMNDVTRVRDVLQRAMSGAG
jgi:hypothetical protein